MKLNLKTISFGVLAAALLAAPVALMKAADADDGGDRHGAKFEQLDLSEAQTSQIEAIRTETRSQIETVLTPEQRTALENSESERGGLRGLDLTDEQRSQIRMLEEGSREQINAILTDEQRQTLAASRREGRGHGRGGRGGYIENLNLSDEQSAQIEAIRAEEKSQQAALLTAEQQATLGDGELGRRAWRSLDLTDEQREQMRAIHEASHEQINAVLTDEQRQQLPERGGN
ncbi:MAG: Spy/CpxP family protein refolding chaperone [Phormidesmis sp.]